MRGSCDTAYLPVRAVKRAMISVARELSPPAVQYPASTDPEPELVEQLRAVFATDGIPFSDDGLMVGSSTIQFLSVVTELLRRDRAADGPVTVAIEEPGYQAAMDAFERFGCTVIGMASDEFGVLPYQLPR